MHSAPLVQVGCVEKASWVQEGIPHRLQEKSLQAIADSLIQHSHCHNVKRAVEYFFVLALPNRQIGGVPAF